jgi:hypothetical protein
LNKKRQDWKRRYAAAFQLVSFDKNMRDRRGNLFDRAPSSSVVSQH